MFLSYAAFRAIDPGQHSIRLGNAFLLALAIGGVGWLSYRLAPRARGAFAFSFGVLLLALTEGVGRQLFNRGITDLLPGVYLLFCFIALSYGKRLLAGVLLGAAFACKLIPGLLAASTVLIWSARPRGSVANRTRVRRRIGRVDAPIRALACPRVPVGHDSLLCDPPRRRRRNFSLVSPPHFLQAPFLGLGGLLVLVGVTAPWWGAATDQRGLARITVVVCFTFLAFNKMIHTNYHFAILPLACAVLAADAMQPGRAWKPGTRPTRSEHDLAEELRVAVQSDRLGRARPFG